MTNYCFENKNMILWPGRSFNYYVREAVHTHPFCFQAGTQTEKHYRNERTYNMCPFQSGYWSSSGSMRFISVCVSCEQQEDTLKAQSPISETERDRTQGQAHFCMDMHTQHFKALKLDWESHWPSELRQLGGAKNSKLTSDNFSL